MCSSHTIRMFTPEEIPGLVADGIRSIRGKHPEFQSHLRKRLAQFNGLSLSWTDKLVCGQFEKLDAAHLLNSDQFFDGLLIREILQRETDDQRIARILEKVKEIERLTRV